MQPKMGGKFHLKLNMGTRPIAYKYREGKMKSTLKREWKARETVKMETIKVSSVWFAINLDCWAVVGGWCEVSKPHSCSNASLIERMYLWIFGQVNISLAWNGVKCWRRCFDRKVESYSSGAETFPRLRQEIEDARPWGLMGVGHGVPCFAGFTASKTVAWCMVWMLAPDACLIVHPEMLAKWL